VQADKEGEFGAVEIMNNCIILYDFIKINKPIEIIEIINQVNFLQIDRCVLKYMQMFGINYVRGGSYITPILPEYMLQSLTDQFKTMTSLPYEIQKQIDLIESSPINNEQVINLHNTSDSARNRNGITCLCERPCMVSHINEGMPKATRKDTCVNGRSLSDHPLVSPQRGLLVLSGSLTVNKYTKYQTMKTHYNTVKHLDYKKTNTDLAWLKCTILDVLDLDILYTKLPAAPSALSLTHIKRHKQGIYNRYSHLIVNLKKLPKIYAQIAEFTGKAMDKKFLEKRAQIYMNNPEFVFDNYVYHANTPNFNRADSDEWAKQFALIEHLFYSVMNHICEIEFDLSNYTNS